MSDADMLEEDTGEDMYEEDGGNEAETELSKDSNRNELSQGGREEEPAQQESGWEDPALSPTTSEVKGDGDIEGAANSKGGKDGPSPEELNQRYLRLLSKGKLASKEKMERSSSKAPPFTSTHQGDEDGIKSVYEADIARLRATAKNMDIEPLIQQPGSPHSTRPATSASSTGGAAGPGSVKDGGISPDRRGPLSARSSRTLSPSRSLASSQGRQGSVKAQGSQADDGRGAPSRSSSASWGVHSGGMGPPMAGNPFRKLYTPGPGAYTPSVDRKGGWDTSAFGFGTARQRPPHVCIQEPVFSPGPIYLPSKEPSSTLTNLPRYRFSRQFTGSRFENGVELASNHPHWNPGPGNYEARSLATGGKCEAGAETPKFKFGLSKKLVSPESNFCATVLVSHSHAKHENMNVHSPGPARYSPSPEKIRFSPAHYSMPAKAASYFDQFLDPDRQPSPGPVYNPSNRDRTGGMMWGSEARTTFGNATKSWDPERNLSAAPFISDAHAKTANAGVHSPGPIYSPRKKKTVPTPVLSSGQLDRFYSRFEPGRIQ